MSEIAWVGNTARSFANGVTPNRTTALAGNAGGGGIETDQ